VAEDFYRDLVRLLRAHGCELVRQGKGSHEIWKSPISLRTFTVPHPCKRRHTANAALKDAGIDEKL